MSISLIASTTQGGSGPTAAVDTTGVSLLVVAVSWYHSGGDASVSDSKGNTWTPATIYQSSNQAVRIFTCHGGTVGAGHTFSVIGSSIFPSIAVLAFSGADPLDSETGASSGSASSLQPGSLTPSGNGCVVVTAINDSVGSTLTVDGSYTAETQDYNPGNSLGIGLAYWIQGTAAATNPTWSWTAAGEAVATLAVFTPTGGGGGGGSLAAGVASVTGTTATTASLSCTAASGGTSPYTYQWYRSPSSGTLGSTVAGATALILTDTGLTPATNYYYTLRATDSAGSPATADSNQVLAATASGMTTVPVTDSHLDFSPGNWYSDGGGSYLATNIKGSSTYSLTNTPGSYLKTILASGGSGSIALDLDTTILQGITVGNCPVLAWSIDEGAFQTQQLAYSASPVQITLGSALAAGNHTVTAWFRAVDLTGSSSMGDRWTNPATGFSGLKVTGLTIDVGSTLAAPAVRPARVLWFGDSSLEGAGNVNGTLGAAGQDATWSFGLVAAVGLDAEVGIVGFAAQGYEQGGFGNVPPLSAAWSYYFAGASRTGQPLDAVACSHGINGTTLAADVAAWIGQVRAAYPSINIYITTPWERTNAAAIITGVADYQAANPADLNVYLIDPQTIPAGAAYQSGDVHHPDQRGHALIGAAFAGTIRGAGDMTLTQLQAELDARGLTTTTTDRIDVAITSRAAPGAAMALTGDERNAAADALLTRDWTAVNTSVLPARCVLNALRFLRNHWKILAGTLTIYKEDDTTTAWTKPVVTDPAAAPVTEIGP